MKLIFAALAALALAGCGDTVATSTTPTPEVTTVNETPAAMPDADADPYDVYLANNPDTSFILSREDAQTRAMLGCDTDWAPGTIDAVLADAYDVC